MDSFQKGVLAFTVLVFVGALGVFLIGLPMDPYLEGFDAKSKAALRDCEEKYQKCINLGGNPVECTGRYNTCSSIAASKNPLVNRGDTSTPTGDRDKQLSAPAALQKSGKIWAPNYIGLYQGLADESRAPESEKADPSWVQRVIAFFFGPNAIADGFSSKNAACERDFTKCVREGGLLANCTTLYNRCTGASDIPKSSLQTTSTSPIRDASGNLVRFAGRVYTQNDINNPFYFALANTTNPYSRQLNAGDYEFFRRLALAGGGAQTSSSKAFLDSIAARVPTNQGITRPTDAQLAAAQAEYDEIPSAARYTPSTSLPRAPHQEPEVRKVQLQPVANNYVQKYVSTPSIREHVRQETKNAIANALASLNNEYEVKYVYA